MVPLSVYNMAVKKNERKFKYLLILSISVLVTARALVEYE